MLRMLPALCLAAWVAAIVAKLPSPFTILTLLTLLIVSGGLAGWKRRSNATAWLEGALAGLVTSTLGVGVAWWLRPRSGVAGANHVSELGSALLATALLLALAFVISRALSGRPGIAWASAALLALSPVTFAVATHSHFLLLSACAFACAWYGWIVFRRAGERSALLLAGASAALYSYVIGGALLALHAFALVAVLLVPPIRIRMGIVPWRGLLRTVVAATWIAAAAFATTKIASAGGGSTAPATSLAATNLGLVLYAASPLYFLVAVVGALEASKVLGTAAALGLLGLAIGAAAVSVAPSSSVDAFIARLGIFYGPMMMLVIFGVSRLARELPRIGLPARAVFAATLVALIHYRWIAEAVAPPQ